MRKGVGIVGLWLIIGIGPAARLPAQALDEYSVKAALVLNFARFTEWPSEVFAAPTDTVDVCVIGDEVVEAAFTSIDDESVGERRVRLMRLDTLRNLDNCQVLFVGGTDRSELPRIFTATEGRPVLTIGEMAGFAEAGGLVSFDTVRGKIRFSVNLEATRRAGLRLSSRLLKLAVIVGNTSLRPEVEVPSSRQQR